MCEPMNELRYLTRNRNNWKSFIENHIPERNLILMMTIIPICGTDRFWSGMIARAHLFAYLYFIESSLHWVFIRIKPVSSYSGSGRPLRKICRRFLYALAYSQVVGALFPPKLSHGNEDRLRGGSNCFRYILSNVYTRSCVTQTVIKIAVAHRRSCRRIVPARLFESKPLKRAEEPRVVDRSISCTYTVCISVYAYRTSWTECAERNICADLATCNI